MRQRITNDRQTSAVARQYFAHLANEIIASRRQISDDNMVGLQLLVLQHHGDASATTHLSRWYRLPAHRQTSAARPPGPTVHPVVRRTAAPPTVDVQPGSNSSEDNVHDDEQRRVEEEFRSS